MIIDHISNSGNNSADNTTITWSHTITNSDLLLVMVYADQTSGTFDPATGLTITYNGLALTRRSGGRFETRDGISYWSLLNPPTGSHNIVATMAFTGSIIGAAISFVGTNSSQLDDTVSNLDTSGTITTISQTVNASAIGEYITVALGINPQATTSGYAITNGTIIASLDLTCAGDNTKKGIFGYLNSKSSSIGLQTATATWTGNATGYAGLIPATIAIGLGNGSGLFLDGD